MKKLFKSFVYAGQGIRHCLSHERNFQLHSGAAGIVIFLAFFLRCTGVEWILLLFCMALVISLEMLNTAVEKLCNHQQISFDLQIKIIKDVAAGAVLVSASAAAICGAIIFIPKIINLFQTCSLK